MNNRLSVPLYASLLSMALLTACTSGDQTTESQQTSQGQGTGQGQTAEGVITVLVVGKRKQMKML